MQLGKTPPYASLLLLQTICAKRNLAAAAETLGMSSSSASRHLSELREIFSDKLFTRYPGGLVPTRRALEIAQQSDLIIAGYERLLEPKKFEPSAIVREVRIGCADNAPFSLFPHFVDELIAQAPNITVSFLPLQENRFAMLARGELDFVVSPIMKLPEELKSLKIGTNEYVLASGPKHPFALNASKKLSSTQVLTQSFADICFRTQPGGPYQSVREIAFPAWAAAKSSLRTTQFLSVITTLQSSSLLIVLPQKTAAVLAQLGLIVILATEEKSVVHTPLLIWHERADADLELQWVRSVLCASAAG